MTASRNPVEAAVARHPAGKAIGPHLLSDPETSRDQLEQVLASALARQRREAAHEPPAIAAPSP